MTDQLHICLIIFWAFLILFCLFVNLILSLPFEATFLFFDLTLIVILLNDLHFY